MKNYKKKSSEYSLFPGIEEIDCNCKRKEEFKYRLFLLLTFIIVMVGYGLQPKLAFAQWAEEEQLPLSNSSLIFDNNLSTFEVTNPTITSSTDFLIHDLNGLGVFASTLALPANIYVSNGMAEETRTITFPEWQGLRFGDYRLKSRNIIVNDRLYFFVKIDDLWHIWSTDGSQEGTREEVNAQEAGFSEVTHIVAFGDYIAFAAFDADLQYNLYILQEDGVVVEAALENQLYSPALIPIVVFEDQLFAVDIVGSSKRLITVDGAGNPTVRFTMPGTGSGSFIQRPFVAGDFLYFSGSDGSGASLWRYTGNDAISLFDSSPGVGNHSGVRSPVASGNGVFFFSSIWVPENNQFSGMSQLYFTDGTLVQNVWNVSRLGNGLINNQALNSSIQAFFDGSTHYAVFGSSSVSPLAPNSWYYATQTANSAFPFFVNGGFLPTTGSTFSSSARNVIPAENGVWILSPNKLLFYAGGPVSNIQNFAIEPIPFRGHLVGGLPWISGFIQPGGSTRLYRLGTEEGIVPGRVSLVSPEDEAEDVPVFPEFSWNEQQLADTYEIALLNPFDEPVLQETTSDLSLISPSFLGWEIPYTWKVRASNEIGTGAWSDIFTFTTVSEPIAGVPVPIFSLEGGFYVDDQTVFITNYSQITEAGAQVYFTINGPDPGSEDQLYDNETGIVLTDGNGSVTLRARSIDGTGEESEVAFLSYFLPLNIDDIAAFREGQGNDFYRITGEAIVLHRDQQDNRHFIRDESGSLTIMDAFNQIQTSYAAGDAVSGFVGQRTFINDGGLIIMEAFTDPGDAVSTDNDASPVLVTAASVSQENTGDLVIIGRATSLFSGLIEAGEGFNFLDLEDFSTHRFQADFPDADYIGTPTPEEIFSLIAIVGAQGEDVYFTARSSDDFQSAKKTLILGNDVDPQLEQEGWRALSMPIDNLFYQNLLGEVWTQGFEGSNFPEVNPSRSNVRILNSDGEFVSINSLFDQVPSGKGFIYYPYADDNPFSFPEEIVGGFPKNLSVFGIDPQEDVPLHPNMFTGENTYSLLGNPFDANVRFGHFDRENVAGVVYTYVYNLDDGSGNGSFISWSLAGSGSGDLTDGILTPFQGFLVESLSDNPELVARRDAITEDEGVGLEDLPQQMPKLELIASINDEFSSKMWVNFNEEGSLESNIYDAFKLVPIDFQPYTLLYTKADGRALEIKNLPLNPESEVILPVFFEAWQPGDDFYIPMNGSVTVSWPVLDFIPDDWSIEIMDNISGERVNLQDATSVSFELDSEHFKNGGINEHKVAIRTASPNKYVDARLSLIITPSFTDISDEGELPKEISLSQNYPNPFNPSTQIQFEIPVSQELLLEVYNIQGQLVSTLVNGSLAAGRHTITFDASAYSSGIYLYRLRAGDMVLTRKMILIK